MDRRGREWREPSLFSDLLPDLDDPLTLWIAVGLLAAVAAGVVRWVLGW